MPPKSNVINKSQHVITGNKRSKLRQKQQIFYTDSSGKRMPELQNPRIPESLNPTPDQNHRRKECVHLCCFCETNIHAALELLFFIFLKKGNSRIAQGREGCKLTLWEKEQLCPYIFIIIIITYFSVIQLNTILIILISSCVHFWQYFIRDNIAKN